MGVRYGVFTFLKFVQSITTAPQALSFIPALVLGGYWLGGEVALFSVALGLPLLVGICGNWKVKNEPKHEAIAPNFEKKAHDKQVLQAPTSLLTNSGFAIDGSNNARPDALFETMFQPQISNHTGEISGFAISKLKSFDLSKINLNAAEAYGYNNLHSEPSIGSILSDAMRALRSWETTLSIDCGVEIELSEIDFSEVHLVDKICWELDRLSVTPEGVAFSVATKETSHLVALEALLRLSSFGCGIDVKLEEATSEISVLAQKLPLRRLKLGGSLIAGVDKDANRQRRINDILTLSEQLSVETIAVGVSSAGVHAMLAQLGCDHVQGSGIGPPLPFKHTHDWIEAHNLRLQSRLCISGKST